MNQTESFSNTLYADQMHLEDDELSAFITAVAESFGPEQAQVSRKDWLDESELMDSAPRAEARNWHAITVAASARLANRVRVSTASDIDPLIDK